MKLVTFYQGDAERLGVVLLSPIDHSEWVFSPKELERALRLRSGNPFSSLALRLPVLLGDTPWPDGVTELLELGEPALSALRRLIEIALMFWEREDRFLLESLGRPLSEARLASPIPRPRLLFGLVSNCAGPFRNLPSRTRVHLIPQGHQRPETSVVGPGEPIVMPADSGDCGFNVELGVVIGRECRNIPVTEAMRYVAGYTCVCDFAPGNLHRRIQKELQGRPGDWFSDASISWAGKMADTCCGVGPYLVTPDEVGDPYDLMVYTRQNGALRDRAHTAAMLLGVERVISWYSSFATLYPGDILHMGTMGNDGLPVLHERALTERDTLEVEIENIGVLRNPVVRRENGQDWRSSSDPGVSLHPSPSVRHHMTSTLSDWSPSRDKIPTFYRLYGNYRDAELQEGLPFQRSPRFLNGPNSAVGASGSHLSAGECEKKWRVGAELALVMGRCSTNLTASNADDHILGVTPLLSVFNANLGDGIEPPATPQELSVPTVYGYWGDGQNVVLPSPVKLPLQDLPGRKIILTVDGRSLELSTDHYITGPAEVLEWITDGITLLPGAVVTLGRLGEELELTLEPGQVHTLSVEIEGLGRVSATLAPSF